MKEADDKSNKDVNYVLNVDSKPLGISHSPCASDGDTAAQLAIVQRRVSKVLLPILFWVGTLAYLDKGNLSFAAVKLNAQLGFTAVDYGLGSGLFYVGFGIGMLPSTFMTMKYGARWWFGGITIAWGIISTCHALLTTRTGFYVLRLLLGLAEAGGPTSGGHLLAQFYPINSLAVPLTVVVVSSMVSGVFAAPLAAGLMSMEGLGNLAGWQWLFIVEGVPSVLLGAAMMVWLPSHPLTAWMLTPEERELLHQQVHGSPEAADAARTPPRWRQLLSLVWDAVRRPLLWFFVAVAFLWVLSFMSLYSWLPVLVNNMLSGTALAGSTSSGTSHAPAKGPGSSSQSTKAILLSGIPAICASFSMLLLAWHADRVNERSLHVGVPYIVGGVVLTLFTPLYKASFAAGFAVLVIAMTLANASQGVMQSRVIAGLDTKHVGVGLSIYTAVSACLGGFAGPVVVGQLVQKMGSFSQATVAMGAILAGAGLLMVGLFVWEKRSSNSSNSNSSNSGSRKRQAADSGPNGVDVL